MYTAHLDNLRLTDLLFLFLYLQQNITQTVSLMLSKAVQHLSINYLHTTVNIQIQFTNLTQFTAQFKYISQLNNSHIASLFLNDSYFWIGAIDTSDPTRSRADLVCHATQSL